MGFATKQVEVGGGLSAVVRRPSFAVWVEYEDLVNGRYDDEPESQKTRDELAVQAYLAREQGAPPKHEDKPELRKLTRQQARKILEFVQGPFLADTLVALTEAEDVHTFIKPDGQRVEPPPVDLRDVGPARTMTIANAVADFVRESRVFSFRAHREAEASPRPGANNTLASV